MLGWASDTALGGETGRHESCSPRGQTRDVDSVVLLTRAVTARFVPQARHGARRVAVVVDAYDRSAHTTATTAHDRQE